MKFVKIKDSGIETFKCDICGNTVTEYPNNPSPVLEEGKACKECNDSIVLRERLARMGFVMDSKPTTVGVLDSVLEDLPHVEAESGLLFTVDRDGRYGAYSNDGGDTWKTIKSTPVSKGKGKVYYRLETRAQYVGDALAPRTWFYTHHLVPHIHGDVNGIKPPLPLGVENAVHHMDGDPSNNHANNLLVMTKADHDLLEALIIKHDNGTLTDEDKKQLLEITDKYQVEVGDEIKTQPIEVRDNESLIKQGPDEYWYHVNGEFLARTKDKALAKLKDSHYEHPVIGAYKSFVSALTSGGNPGFIEQDYAIELASDFAYAGLDGPFEVIDELMERGVLVRSNATYEEARLLGYGPKINPNLITVYKLSEDHDSKLESLKLNHTEGN